MEDDPKTDLEKAVAVVFSPKFRQYTAAAILPPVAAGALGVAAGCLGWNLGEVACDPYLLNRHPQHIEQDASTPATTSDAAFLSLSAMLPPGKQELSQSMLWRRPRARSLFQHTTIPLVLAVADDTIPPASPGSSG